MWVLDSVMIGFIYLKNKYRDKGNVVLDQYLKSQEQKLASYGDKRTLIDIARIHAIRKNDVLAIKYLNKAVSFGLHSGDHDLIDLDPIFDDLRDDEEFKILVQQAKEDKRILRTQMERMMESGELAL